MQDLYHQPYGMADPSKLAGSQGIGPRMRSQTLLVSVSPSPS